ncbi:AP-3 complex subunit delta [Pichia kudriavzevii]|uniref:AP-3 complex subunit delta n=1 Tax=Pichia kudriavzevii TaxID=4909 RepID=A0A1V2LSB0_PICKU|nr:AP-3 complex subunit delta [Pichia kudriavzevii]
MSTLTMKERLRGFGISFEKSLEDLIKGIRATNSDHEKLASFFERSIQECKNELKSPDLEVKSIAILKLAYLEMYGFDMSWCAFSILEVMASPKFQHKRIGYLAANQILQRQNNDDALIIHYDRLIERLDDDDSSVVSATVNVLCELAYMNPSNYIDLAPKFYKIMKESNNNWMMIRILKLFSSLSLIEPRLKNKLLPEIKAFMVNTKALSLQYECINAILNGNMLSPDDIDTAKLIVSNLLVFFASGDQNLKYVGLLAFIKTCKINQDLIKKHDKIILSSIYDNDITVRETSLEIVNSLVNEHNIVPIITRLTVQLLPYNDQKEQLDKINKKVLAQNSGQDSDDDTDTYIIGATQQPIVVSQKYKYLLVSKIIEICSMNNYENIPSFRWYLGVMTDILKLNVDNKISKIDKMITDQFVDIALRVPSVRHTLVNICFSLCGILEYTGRELLQFKEGLGNCMWIIGEYYDSYLQGESDSDSDSEPDSDSDSFSALQKQELKDLKQSKLSISEIIDTISKQNILSKLEQLDSYDIITTYVGAIAKMYSKFTSTYACGGDLSVSQLEFVKNSCLGVIEILSQFETSSNFELQECALSYVEILKLVDNSLENVLDGIKNTETSSASLPTFLTEGYNQLFLSYPLMPVGASAQEKVKIPDGLDLNAAIDEQATKEAVLIVDDDDTPARQNSTTVKQNNLTADALNLADIDLKKSEEHYPVGDEYQVEEETRKKKEKAGVDGIKIEVPSVALSAARKKPKKKAKKNVAIIE